MNKTELKNFAISARRDLLEKVALRAKLFGIDEKNGLTIEEQYGQLVINGKTYPLPMKPALQSLAGQLKTKGYEQLIEEATYTWFNRIIAIRYMEVNDYLPERVNVLSSCTGKVEPDILSQFESMDLNIDTAIIKDLSRQGETENAYKQLFIAQCNALNKILPFMFEKIQDYTELLLPDYLLDSESVIKKLISNEALTESFTEVEVIGWLYQFYNSETKDKVFANLKKNKKIEKYDIPAATQLFTPKWIVQYMVENSLGKLWLESNPDSSLKESMQYYLEPADQDEEVKERLEEIRYKNVNLEDITIIDPCVGSGHILVYAFDLLYQMYEEAGYPSGEIPQLILEKNLFGLDIDDRATQLASFALMMKARGKSNRIFRKQVELNIYTVQDSNHLNIEGIVQIICNNENEKKELELLINTFNNAKYIGSLIQPTSIDYYKYFDRLLSLSDEQLTLETYQAYDQLTSFKYLLETAKILSASYDIVTTNPPYMGSKGMNNKSIQYVTEFYPKNKSDLYACFVEKTFKLGKDNAFISLITPFTWMFLKSYENIRKQIVETKDITSLVQLEYNAFEAAMVPVCTFILRNTQVNSIGEYIRLAEFRGFENQSKKTLEAINNPYCNYRYQCKTNIFKQIPDYPIAYWTSEKTRQVFQENPAIGEIADLKVGLQTGNNDKFLRLWYEVNFNKIGFNFESFEEVKNNQKKWLPHNKGGSFRKWYGNQEYVINWENDGELVKKEKGAVLRNLHFYLKEGLTWSDLTSGSFSARYTPKGFTFNVVAPTLFIDEKYLFNTHGYINSKVYQMFMDYTITGFHYNNGTLSKLPFKTNLERSTYEIVKKNIMISKRDWDSFETSWDFEHHPFLVHREEQGLLSDAYNRWNIYTEIQFTQLRDNEKELNRFYIDLYGLHDELTPEVVDEEITIRKSLRTRDSKSFLSYFIGCTMGRYSSNIEGLVYAGGDWDNSKYKSFKPNKFGLIQLTDEHYFEDDIIARLGDFLSVTFGAETVEENLQWLAESLELKRNETAEERLRRYFLDEFFKDHCQVYQKRPIYWLVDSGKEKGLRTLIYMHRYQPDSMATIRFEHLQEIQAKYNNEIAAVDLRIVNPNLSATEKRDLEKRKTAYQKRLEELLEFDKNLAGYANAQISIDLDDGVKVNYEKFDKVLAKIK